MYDPNEIQILLATNRPATCNGLKSLLTQENTLYKVTTAQDGHELLKKIESIYPDLLLLDWDLLGRATPILISVVRAYKHNLQIIVFSPKSELKQPVLEAGANAFVDISYPPRELLTVMHRVCDPSNLEEKELNPAVATGSE